MVVVPFYFRLQKTILAAISCDLIFNDMHHSLTEVLVMALTVSLFCFSYLPVASSVPVNFLNQELARFDGHYVVRASITNQEELDTLVANERVLKLDYFTHDKVVGGLIDFRITPAAFKDFKHLGLNYTIRIENIQILLDQEARDNKARQTTKNMLKRSLEAAGRGQPVNDTLKWFENYHPYESHLDWLQLQIISHSNIARAFTAGKSHEGREQSGVIIGSGPNNVVLH